MNYTKDGVYPITIAGIRAAHPNTSFPDTVEPQHVVNFGYLPVEVVIPVFNPAHEKATEGVPVLVAGAWKQSWTVTSKWATLADAQTELRTRVTQKRHQVETGGTTIGGVAIKTDIESQSKLSGALSFVTRNTTRNITWKNATNQFTVLTKAQIEGLSDGVGEFITKCFEAEAAHYSAINNLLNLPAALTYDINTGWPV